MSNAIRCVILRGGTSKGVYLRDVDLPHDPVEREKTILRIFGSPDKRQYIAKRATLGRTARRIMEGQVYV